MDVIQILRISLIAVAALFPLLIALGSGVGLKRGRRVILVIALTCLVVLLVGQLGEWLTRPAPNTEQLDPAILAFRRYLPFTTFVGAVGNSALLLAIMRAGQVRRWVWFVIMIFAALLFALTNLLTTSLTLFYTDYQQAQHIGQAPIFQIVTIALIDVSLLAAVIYGLVGPITARQQT